jgi:flavoprotein
MMYDDILEEMRAHYAMEYSPNYLVSVISCEVPKRIAQVAKMERLLVTTPKKQCKKCIHCERLLPKDPVFFSRNNAHKDGLSNTCKECDKKSRIRRGVVNADGDLRQKDPTLLKMQA